jgi:hypothetical protein
MCGIHPNMRKTVDDYLKDRIPMPINGRVEKIDSCIADIVAALNAGGISTIASCCGHGIENPTIILFDDRIIEIRIKK